MRKLNKFFPEVREHAVRMVQEHRGKSDSPLAETIIGLKKAEFIHRRVPWKTKEAEELETRKWGACFNHHRLLEPLGYVPPAEAEENYYRQLAYQTATVVSGLRSSTPFPGFFDFFRPTGQMNSRMLPPTVIYHAAKRPESCTWISAVVSRRNKNVAAVALANKNARIVWALLAHDLRYETGHTRAVEGT